MDSDDKIFRNFHIYTFHKSENEYLLKLNGKEISTDTFISTPEEEYEIKDNVLIFSTDYAKELSPDNIDCEVFWKVATQNFPLFSISGGVQTITTKEEANTVNLVSAFNLNALKPVENAFNKNPDCMLLEIGPGYGGLENILSGHYSNNNYYAIDVNPLFFHKNLCKCDGRNIPSEIPNGMDIVYSINVFQHLSKSQRTSYYKQIYIILKNGGSFVFGMFVITEKNKNNNKWGYQDENGGVYTSFFKQLTIVDREEELLSELEDIGFEVRRLSAESDTNHYLTFECIKPSI